MPNITLELDDAAFNSLIKLADETAKPAEIFAAELLSDRLNNGELNRIRREIRRLRHDVSLSTQVLLVTTNGVDQEEAKRWVKENLRDC